MATLTQTSERAHFPDALTETMLPVRRISWAAVFAGVILTLIVHILLLMLGTGIGLSTIEPAEGDTPGMTTLGIGAGAWWMVSNVIALFAGGWVAAHLAGVAQRTDSVLHGLLTWALASLLMIYFMATLVGNLVSGVSSMFGAAVSATAQGIAQVAPQAAQMAREQLGDDAVSWDRIKQEAQTLLSQTGKAELQPEALKRQAEQARTDAQQAARSPAPPEQSLDALLDRFIRRGTNAINQVDRDALTNVLVARTDMTREQAAQQVERWDSAYRQAQASMAQVKQQAKEAGQASAEIGSQAAIWGAIALLIGAVAAGLGGALGRPTGILSVAVASTSTTSSRSSSPY